MPRSAFTNRPIGKELQTLRPHHRGIARDLVFCNLSREALAEKYSMTPVQISNIQNSPLFKAEVERLTRMEENAHISVGQELMELANRAVEVLAEDIYQSNSSKKRTDTAFKILDRTGYHPRTDNVGVKSQKLQIINFTPLPGEDPKAAQERMIELTKNLSEGDTD